jgi:proline iminopeptidase
VRKIAASLSLVLCLVATSCVHTRPNEQSGFVDVPGGPVWYEIMGSGFGTPLVVLHGGPGGTSCGLQVLRPLGRDRPVIRYDQLGSGRSGRPDHPSLWNRDRFVAELDTIRSELGLEEIHLLGHSWGGALASYYTLETGGKGIVSLTLSSPLISTGKWIEDTGILRSELPKEVQAVLDEHEAAGTTDSPAYAAATEVFYAQYFTRGPAIEEYNCPDAPRNSDIYEQMWGPTEFYATGSLQDFDLTERLRDLAVPTLFITGEFDEARPETIAQFTRLVPGARLEIIPGVGHASFSRAPDHFRQIVITFLEEAEGADEAR